MIALFPSGATNSSPTPAFLGTPATVSFTDSKTAAQVTGTTDFASSDGSGIISLYSVCYQPQGGGTITPVAQIAPEFTAPAGSFFAQTVTGVVGNLAPGTYLVGICTASETSNVAHGAASGTVLVAETASGFSHASPVRPASQMQTIQR